MSKKVKKTIRFSIKIKDCEKVFREELEPGVVAMQEITFTETKETYSGYSFAASLLRRQEDFLKDNVEVLMKEVGI